MYAYVGMHVHVYLYAFVGGPCDAYMYAFVQAFCMCILCTCILCTCRSECLHPVHLQKRVSVSCAPAGVRICLCICACKCEHLPGGCLYVYMRVHFSWACFCIMYLSAWMCVWCVTVECCHMDGIS